METPGPVFLGGRCPGTRVLTPRVLTLKAPRHIIGRLFRPSWSGHFDRFRVFGVYDQTEDLKKMWPNKGWRGAALKTTSVLSMLAGGMWPGSLSDEVVCQAL